MSMKKTGRTLRRSGGVGDVAVQGLVTGVANHQFTPNTGINSITIDVGHMPANPLDNEDYPKLERVILCA